jgi:glutamine synthetase
MCYAPRLNMVKSKQKECNTFHKVNPDISGVDVLIADLNGVIRGKRIASNALENVYKNGVYFTTSLFALDINGDTIEETGLGIVQGDGDSTCFPIPKTLTTAPWQKKSMGQLLLTMVDGNDKPVFANPRQVLNQILERFNVLNLTPVVAVELEFYLLDNRRDGKRRPQPPISNETGKRGNNTQVYAIDNLDDYGEFLSDVFSAAKEQGIPVYTAVAENAPGQFEINLKHEVDPLSACDNAILLKRLIKGVAQKHGMQATFMAKPYTEIAGNGMHIHLSLLDEKGNNVFSNPNEIRGSKTLQHAIGGLTTTMKDSMSLFCPNANSYRRFQPNLHVAMAPTWGVDNRTVAVRIPNSPEDAKRLEHRIAGADANPYLVVSALLAGIHFGITEKITPPKISTGDASVDHPPELPLSLDESLNSFVNSSFIKKYFGETFCEHYHIFKTIEMKRFNKHVTPLELDWYLRTV